MASIEVRNNQTLFDLCIIHYGTLDPLFELAQFNDVSITQELPVGMVINIPESTLKNIQIKNYYRNNDIAPATNTPIRHYSAIGIGDMIIEDDFIIPA